MSERSDEGTVVEKQASRVKPPPMYQVVLLNDDYTPMEFVVGVLQKFFGKGTRTATQIMLKIHHEGRGVCGVYPRTSPRPRSSWSAVIHASTSIRCSALWRKHDRAGTRSQPAHGLCGGPAARHEFITVEHLLLALLDNPSAAEVLRACACNIEDLRKSLQNFITDNTPILPPNSEVDTQPTLGFQRVIQRAIMHVQSHRQRQEGSHRRQRAGRDLRREGLARRLLPAPAGRDAARRRQLHRARHHEVRPGRKKRPNPRRSRSRKAKARTSRRRSSSSRRTSTRSPRTARSIR